MTRMPALAGLARRRRPRARRRRRRAREIQRRRPRAHRERHRISTFRRTASTSSTASASRTSRTTRAQLRPLARALGRQRQARAHAHAGRRRVPGRAYSPDGKWIAFLSDRGDEDAKTQVWVMPADAGEAEALTAFPGGVADFDWSPDSARLAVIARRSRAPGGRGRAEAAAADRHRPLLLQGGLRRLADRQAPAPLPVRRRRQEGDAAHLGRARRAHAGLVARRQAHRLRHQARRRPGPPPQLGHLRDRGARRRDGEAGHHASPARTTTRTASRRPPGARTAGRSPTCSRRRGQVDLLRALVARDRRRRERRGHAARRHRR